MIESLLLVRLLSDYLWELKAASIISVILFAASCFLFFLFKRKRFKLILTDLIFAALLAAIFFSEIINMDRRSEIEVLKFVSYYVLYLAGRVGPQTFTQPSIIGYTCLTILAGFFIASLVGLGYQDWGHVATFSGGYFFKTDMAVSALILLAIVSSTLKSRFILLVCTMLAVYVVFKTNARIALPLVFLIPVLAELIRSGRITKLNLKAIGYVALVVSIGMVAFLVMDLHALGLLGFDFSTPFSAANTQGRSVIWSALIEAFLQADFYKKIFGLGLNADIYATNMYSEKVQVAGVRAHNSYLYLLICTGVFGSLLFYALMISIIKKIPLLISSADKGSLIIAIFLTLLLVIFAWTSLTTEIIIRVQLMGLVFFFSGMVVQRYLSLKSWKNYKCLDFF